MMNQVSLAGHEERVWHVCWSACGSLLASCGADKVVRLWKRSDNEVDGTKAGIGSWECVATLEDTQSRTIRSCEFSPCGTYLAATSFDSTTVVWSRGINDSGEYAWECISTLEGHENEVKSISWSHNGQLIATCSRDKSIWIWEAPPKASPMDPLPEDEVECECVSVLTGHMQDVKCVKWSTNEDVLFSGSYDDTIRVWQEQIDDWGCVDVLQGHSNTVWGLAIEPNGARVASCSQDCTVRIWEKEGDKWKTCKVLEGRHDRTIFSIDWSSDDKWLATAGGDDTIIIQDVEKDFGVVTTLKHAHDSDVNCVRFNPKQPKLFASCSDDSLVKIWKME
mmetsp:Transcript_8728/g.14133  ORF Transcript_8728/g.14133 Transcript_8728/m.14133 type:complete len:336 (+) Transcript_8728:335-1342(+)